MSTSEEDVYESEMLRLIRAAYPSEARLDPLVRQRVFHQLRTLLNTPAAHTGFPTQALGSFTALGGVLLLWLGFQWNESGMQVFYSGYHLVSVMVLLINLALIPISSFIVVLKRRVYHG